MMRLLLILIFTCACITMQAQVVITTICGNDTGTYNGDSIAAKSAHINVPEGLCLDNIGNIYIADGFNQRIRKINTQTGVITTIAGNGNADYSGDGGLATLAELFVPEDICLDKNYNIYIADAGNNRIRKVDTKTGIITTVVGIGPTGVSTGGFGGDGGAATDAKLNTPVGACIDKAGNIYIADYDNNRVRRVDKETNIITTVAGNGGGYM